MNNKIRLVIALVIFLLASVSCTQAGSIWAKRDKNMRVLYADDVAHQIGDVLTVIITEASKVDNKSQRDLKKDTARSTTFDGVVGGFGDLGEFGITASSSNSLGGKADYKDQRSFVDRVTVTVVDVMPNRSLVVMGTRSRDIAGDVQTIEISGIVRPSDIAFDNTVKSEQVANFRIVSDNKGVAAPYNKPGWLGTIFDIIWPF